MRDLVWSDANHLPTLFVVLEMDAQVFRSRYQVRSVTPVWNDNFIMAISNDNAAGANVLRVSDCKCVITTFRRWRAQQQP